MSVYPSALDDDTTILRVDDNLTEIGGISINQLREAVFAIEKALGKNIGGSLSSLADRFAIAHNNDGHIKASELTSIGLATLPIVNSQVASNAGIEESKLSLDYSTSDLHTGLIASEALINSLVTFTNEIFSDLILHITGSVYLSDGSTAARHVASQIDINAVTSDPRDPSFVWTGLLDKDGNQRSATQVAQALLQINNDLTSHENSTSQAHIASAISVDTDDFIEIPTSATDVQKALQYLDDAETLNLGQHRATQHANAIANIARSAIIGVDDGYAPHAGNVVATTPAQAFLVHSPNTMPVDDLSFGDDLIKFNPEDNSDFSFDAQFSQVQVGDLVTINYNNGLQASYYVESIRFTPGSEWIIRINGVNLCDTATALARIDRPSADRDTSGILAVASANAHNASGPTSTTILSSVIVGHPRGASALGLGFDAGQLNSTHYKLYLQLYPTGNPTEQSIVLPAVDVTGNAGITPGKYTLDSVVSATNDAFRTFGYNYRFIAFAKNGEFGLMLADPIGTAAFSIINGDNSSGTLSTGSFTLNVIGGSTLDDFDALGFGSLGADVASPVYQSTWVDETAAQIPTQVLIPLKQRYYHVNGRKLDQFAPTYLANDDGYWDGYISARNVIGISTVETTYTVVADLSPAGLKPGKTIVVQPTVDSSDSLYSDVDYGRFIIKDVNFVDACGDTAGSTTITVINSIHAAGVPVASSGVPSLAVKLFFGYDSVSFNKQNIIDTSPTATNYNRFHEIYITDEGKTFSHERARMPQQVESPTLLGTANWHVVSVSPKLRGYIDGTANIFNKYIRFNITDYDTTTGEFDGYIGQRVVASTNTTNVGPTIKGRKNVVTRFYDETYLDYVDLIYRDDSASPGTAILSTATSRYVDIEIFPTLDQDDQIMLIASCEVNWNPQTGQDIVQYVQDRRSFGSVDETDFTQSALDFISAADSHLHENGIIRGLGLDYISLVANSGEIFFKGGIAIVNGKVVPVNNQSVTIPRAYISGTSLPQTLRWVVCVNEFGELVPIFLTPSKEQFFATGGTGSYYLPSVTFFELVQTRKDLTPIAIAQVHVASLSVSAVTDIRRMVVKESANRTLTWVADDQIIGNFNDFDILKNWIINMDGYQNDIRAVGAFDITESVDFTGLTGLGPGKRVNLNGLNAVFNVTSDIGFIISDNLTINECTFNYNPTGVSFGAPEYLLNRGASCLYHGGFSNPENIQITNCIFNSYNTDQRYPHILFEVTNGNIFKNILISNNSFNDIDPVGDVGKSQASIAFLGIDDGDTAEPGTLNNVKIEHNTCSHQQGIYVTAINASTPGVNVINTCISHNVCGIVGYYVSGQENLSPEFGTYNLTSGLDIQNNSCFIVGNFFDTGDLILDVNTSAYGFGKVSIKNNKCHWITVQAVDGYLNNQYSALTIENNFLDGYSTSYLGLFTPTIPNYAIFVANYATENSTSIVSNNYINFGRYDSTTYGYDRGIQVDCSGTITHNVVKGLNASGRGIHVQGGDGAGTRNYLVCHNQIYRGSTSINSYIKMPSSGTKSQGICTDNFFDSTTIDGSNLSVADNTSNTFVVTRNKNQTFSYVVPVNTGEFSLDNVLSGTEAVTTSNITQPSSLGIPAFKSFVFNYNDTSTTVTAQWVMPLIGLIPGGCTVTAASLVFNPSTTSGTNSLKMIVSTAGATDLNTTTWTPASTDTTLTVTISANSLVRYGYGSTATFPYLMVLLSQNHSSTCTITIKDVTLSFIY